MQPRVWRGWLLIQLIAALALVPRAAGTVEPVRYRISFPQPERHWLRVEAEFSAPADRPLDLRMSRASPGRYSLHDFAKNVYGVRAFDRDGRTIPLAQADPSGWRAEGHGGAVRVVYDVFGDHVDGTYLGVDATHALINMPAAIMWARGLDDRPAVVTFEPPEGREWRIATQLFPGASPFEFTAPNLQYLMDSPTELGPIALRTFMVDGRAIRFAAHHGGTADELDGFVKDVEKIVREQGRVYGEYPDFEPGHFTFLAHYLPHVHGDGMEHRNSSVISSPGSIVSDRTQLLGTVAHEFFHAWNVERIRPRSLEPFDFDGPNMSSELWLAEGFTQYYGMLTLSRAGLADLSSTLTEVRDLASAVLLNGARHVRSAEEMSRMATFTDGGQPVDRTNWSTTFISYYQFGGAIALALDLSLRDRTAGRVTLDDYMRALWSVHGRPGDGRPGYVARPYTMADAEARLAEVAGDGDFARDFFQRFISGHEVADYAQLLRQAGLQLRRPRASEAWIGEVTLATGAHGVRLEGAPGLGTPLDRAGVDRDDEIVEIGGRRTDTVERLHEALHRLEPGQTVPLVVRSSAFRTAPPGVTRRTSITVSADPALELVPVETAGTALTPTERAFRRAWLGSR